MNHGSRSLLDTRLILSWVSIYIIQFLKKIISTLFSFLSCDCFIKGMTMLTLFFLGKIGFYRAISGPTTFDRANMNAMDSSFLLKQRLLTIIGVLPMLLALYVSASRVHDDYHHPADVVAGSMIGMLCSVFSYSLW